MLAPEVPLRAKALFAATCAYPRDPFRCDVFRRLRGGFAPLFQSVTGRLFQSRPTCPASFSVHRAGSCGSCLRRSSFVSRPFSSGAIASCCWRARRVAAVACAVSEHQRFRDLVGRGQLRPAPVSIRPAGGRPSRADRGEGRREFGKTAQVALLCLFALVASWEAFVHISGVSSPRGISGT